MKKKSNPKLVIANSLGAVQGDVPILKVDGLTPGGKLSQKRIVALGEATGHHHHVVGDVQVYEVERTIDGQLFPGFEIVVVEDKPARIEHKSDGEHYAVEMTPGIYFIPAPGFQQVEYDGANERRVRD